LIPNDFIQSLLARIDIVEVIDPYVKLKKAGANFSACCPFHSEKTPSFTVSPSKQFYHCFGCGAHGTAIGFLIEYAGKTFPDAVEDLARDAGIEVPRQAMVRSEAERPQDDAALSELMLLAARHYRARLRETPRAIDYLKSRGLSGEIALRFGIGYAPDSWQGLADVVPYAGKSVETAGLVIAGDGGKRYDRFRDRIMFPIHDQGGRVIGFGGRVLDKGEPKYLNSPETPLFSKGRELYGLLQARSAIREAGKVVVVEGYMDVVALAQHGVSYAVATLGTATTPMHAQRLLRITDHVVFCFDGDDAGRRAAWRALENALPVVSDGKNVSFLFLPDGEDPDDFIRSRGKAAFEAALAAATPLSEFLIQQLSARHPPQSAEGKAALLHAAKPLLEALKAPVLSALVRRRFASLSGLSDADLAPLLPMPVQAPRSAPPRTARSPVMSVARRLLRTLVFKPELARGLDFTLFAGSASGPEMAALSFVIEQVTGSDPITTGALLESARNSGHAELLHELSVDILGWDDTYDVNAEFAGAVEKIRRNQVDQAFRQEIAAGGVAALSPEQRARISAYRRADGAPPADADYKAPGN